MSKTNKGRRRYTAPELAKYCIEKTHEIIGYIL